MRERFLVPIGTLIAFIVVIWIVTRREPDQVHLESVPRKGETMEARSVSMIDVPSPAPAERRVASPSDQVSLRVVSNGEVISSRGTLRFGALGRTPQEVEIEKGRGLTVQEFLPWLRSDELEAWYFSEVSLPTRVLSVAERSAVSRDKTPVLDFEIGATYLATVEVRDFQGKPIEGARIELEGFGGAGFVTSDEAGNWTGEVHCDLPVSVVVRSFGYGNGAAELEPVSSGALSCEVQLGRYLAAAVIADSREIASYRYQAGEQYLHSSRTNSFTSALEDSERRVELGEHERIRWTVLLEKAWSNHDRLEIVKIDPDGVRPNQSLSLPLLHVNDQGLAPARFPDTWAHSRAPIDVELLGIDEAGSHPSKIQLVWSRIGGEGNDSPQYGYRLSDLNAPVFRFYLEPGSYSVQTAGVGPTGLRSADAPTIRSLAGVEVSAVVIPPARVRVNIEEGVFYAGYFISDSAGIPLSLAWQVEQASVEMSNRILIVVPSPEPKYRFFRASEEYTVLLAPRGSGALRDTGVHSIASKQVGPRIIEIPVPVNFH
jgi:hypothetical protein